MSGSNGRSRSFTRPDWQPQVRLEESPAKERPNCTLASLTHATFAAPASASHFSIATRQSASRWQRTPMLTAASEGRRQGTEVAGDMRSSLKPASRSAIRSHVVQLRTAK